MLRFFACSALLLSPYAEEINADGETGQVVHLLADVDIEPVVHELNPPVVVMHGMGDFASNPMGMATIGKLISKNVSAYVRNVEICSDPARISGCAVEDQQNGFIMTMDEQVEQFARVVRGDTKLAGGFNAIGFSQGNALIRGYIHRHNDPPVKSFISMHGVMMGVASLPQCPTTVPGLGLLCRTIGRIAAFGAYTDFVQDHLAQANYVRDPLDLGRYRSNCHFLPYINNEVDGEENLTYAEHFKSLEKLVLVMAEGDTVVHPKESEHFGFFRDGSDKDVVSMRNAPWYLLDSFGLRSLDEAHKIDFDSTPGNHLRFTEDYLLGKVSLYFGAKATHVVV